MEQVTVKDAACRLSHKRVTTLIPPRKAALVDADRGALSLALRHPEVKITVTQNGVTVSYEQSGKAAVFTTTGGGPLELFREWA
ncbi:MAG: hypothetical protein ACLU9S_20330 [Oscillospiraceae bacterium]